MKSDLLNVLDDAEVAGSLAAHADVNEIHSGQHAAAPAPHGEAHIQGELGHGDASERDSVGDTTFSGGDGHTYWQSLEQLTAEPGFLEKIEREFPQGAAELEMSGTNRREFLGVFGASMAMAGVTMTGCIRKPKEKVIPFTQRPETLIPGKPRQYATAVLAGPTVVGVLVESFDGRPTKIEGNPEHPNSLGAANAWAQASVLDLYDPHRSQKPLRRPGAQAAGQVASWDDVYAALKSFGAGAAGAGAAGLAILTEKRPSPTLHALLAEVQERFPGVQVFEHDPASTGNTEAGLALVGVENVRAVYAFDKANVIASFDSDFLATEGDVLRNARLFSKKRRITSEKESMSRFYQVEPCFTVTGAGADNHLRVAGSQVGEVLADVASLVAAAGAPAGGQAVQAALQSRKRSAHAKWASAIAKDLLANKGQSLVIVGDRQPAHVHALGAYVNEALGNLNSTVTFTPANKLAKAGDLPKLIAAMGQGAVKTLVILGGNPVFESPAFAEALAKVPTSLHLSSHVDETSGKTTWHVPRSHYLEAWGDLRATDGTLSVVQPLIAPLYDTISEVELLGRLLGKAQPTGFALVRGHWVAAGVLTATKDWNRALHDGLLKGSAAPAIRLTPTWSGLAPALAKEEPVAVPEGNRFEVALQLDTSVYDGRYATNPWMQEIPDPVTKVTWDNAALLSPSTARRLGVKTGGRIEIVVDGKKLTPVVNETPGVAENNVVLSVGYGRRQSGPVARHSGFNVYLLQKIGAPAILTGATVTKAGGKYAVATTQMHHTMIEPITDRKRPVVREVSLDRYKKEPQFVSSQEFEPFPRAQVKNHLWTLPNPTEGNQWGMSIDLSTCIGCNACTIACQAENNIPVVGKERVIQGREMHWIRLDRYFDGKDMDDPLMVFQPLGCLHCETAPCEGVCPVAATTHSPEGLNDMAYNRCIGTRYCSNNCPYKVRRFNFFAFQKENDEKFPLLSMQRNPDVTVRFRGVMEKCTYCVQRINRAKIEAKRDGNGTVPDGTIAPACAQTCPTNAIVFGNINDPKSAVSKAKQQNRTYELLGDLNTKPRTTYLAKVRNPNPELT